MKLEKRNNQLYVRQSTRKRKFLNQNNEIGERPAAEEKTKKLMTSEKKQKWIPTGRARGSLPDFVDLQKSKGEVINNIIRPILRSEKFLLIRVKKLILSKKIKKTLKLRKL